jgi:hypothetical protein
MTSSAPTTDYNRAYDDSDINDLITPEKTIDGFLLCSSRERDDLANPCYPHPLEEVEAVPPSLWEYNVSQEQWSKFRNGIYYQQKLCLLVNIVFLPMSIVTFCLFYLLLTLVTHPSRCQSCSPYIKSANFPGGEDVLDSLLISLSTAFFVSLLVTLLYGCSHSPNLNRICRNTLGTTCDGVLISVRICSDHDHSWIELYIPRTFSLPQPV